MSNANPSIDPANEDNLTGVFRHVFNKMMQSKNSMLPCRVIAFNRGSPQRVQVEHLIYAVTTDGQQVSRGQIASLPVYQYGGGGFVLSFNINVGDLGWIKANDRDISIFLQSYSQSSPQTFRTFDFADAVFFPDVMRGYTVASEDSSNAVLQSLDGSTKISLQNGKITIKATNIILEGDVQCTGAVTADNGISVGGSGANNLTVTGNLRTIGDITASGNITPHVP